MKNNLILSFSILMLITTTASASQTDTLKFNQERLFLGVHAGMPMAEADFSSFGADRFRPGWDLGLNAGYRFTDVWSLEMTASWGQFWLGEKSCCMDYGYFLGNDLKRYHPDLIPDGMDGRYYRDIKNRTFVQRYGLQVNMNVLGFFAGTKTGPWRLEVSPTVHAIITSSDILAKSDNAPFVENVKNRHLGYGGQIQVSYAVAENMNIGIYGGYTQVTGKQMDAMPGLHSTNFIIDAGVKFTIGLKKTRRNARQAEKPVYAESVEVTTDKQVQIAPAEDSPVAKADEKVQVTPAEEVPVAQEEQNIQEEVSPFPVIYFSFNSIWIEPSERAKVKEIADMMKADKSIRVLVTGWGDAVGGEEANKRVSLQRAEAVKRVLGQWLVPAERVETAGGGIKTDAATDAEARNATTIVIL